MHTIPGATFPHVYPRARFFLLREGAQGVYDDKQVPKLWARKLVLRASTE